MLSSLQTLPRPPDNTRATPLAVGSPRRSAVQSTRLRPGITTAVLPPPHPGDSTPASALRPPAAHPPTTTHPVHRPWSRWGPAAADTLSPPGDAPDTPSPRSPTIV